MSEHNWPLAQRESEAARQRKYGEKSMSDTKDETMAQAASVIVDLHELFAKLQGQITALQQDVADLRDAQQLLAHLVPQSLRA